MRVLVIDDEPRMLRFIRRAMSGDRCEVVTAGSASEAFALLAGDHYDAIICDLQLTDLRGPTS
jgi:two-component system KDP operon response regulator KdpE